MYSAVLSLFLERMSNEQRKVLVKSRFPLLEDHKE